MRPADAPTPATHPQPRLARRLKKKGARQESGGCRARRTLVFSAAPRYCPSLINGKCYVVCFCVSFFHRREKARREGGLADAAACCLTFARHCTMVRPHYSPHDQPDGSSEARFPDSVCEMLLRDLKSSPKARLYGSPSSSTAFASVSTSALCASQISVPGRSEGSCI